MLRIVFIVISCLLTIGKCSERMVTHDIINGYVQSSKVILERKYMTYNSPTKSISELPRMRGELFPDSAIVHIEDFKKGGVLSIRYYFPQCVVWASLANLAYSCSGDTLFVRNERIADGVEVCSQTKRNVKIDSASVDGFFILPSKKAFNDAKVNNIIRGCLTVTGFVLGQKIELQIFDVADSIPKPKIGLLCSLPYGFQQIDAAVANNTNENVALSLYTKKISGWYQTALDVGETVYFTIYEDENPLNEIVVKKGDGRIDTYYRKDGYRGLNVVTTHDESLVLDEGKLYIHKRLFRSFSIQSQ